MSTYTEAIYTGPNDRLDGEKALIRDDPNDPALVLAQFDKNPLYMGSHNLGSGWHAFYRRHFTVDMSPPLTPYVNNDPKGKTVVKRVKQAEPPGSNDTSNGRRLFVTNSSGQSFVRQVFFAHHLKTLSPEERRRIIDELKKCITPPAQRVWAENDSSHYDDAMMYAMTRRREPLHGDWITNEGAEPS